MKLNRKNKKGFTIVELVIVIGVIGILSAILIPTFANLTTKAQESAAKEQVSNAYTAYLMEAADNVVDGEFFKKSNAETPTYTEVKVSISQIAQDKVALKLNDTWYTYTSEKGWDKSSEPGNKELVVSYDALGDGYTGLYKKTGEAYSTTPVVASDLSTFNGVIVYAITQA